MEVGLCPLGLADGKREDAGVLVKLPRESSALQFPSACWASLFQGAAWYPCPDLLPSQVLCCPHIVSWECSSGG